MIFGILAGTAQPLFAADECIEAPGSMLVTELVAGTRIVLGNSKVRIEPNTQKVTISSGQAAGALQANIDLVLTQSSSVVTFLPSNRSVVLGYFEPAESEKKLDFVTPRTDGSSVDRLSLTAIRYSSSCMILCDTVSAEADPKELTVDTLTAALGEGSKVCLAPEQIVKDLNVSLTASKSSQIALRSSQSPKTGSSSSQLGSARVRLDRQAASAE